MLVKNYVTFKSDSNNKHACFSRLYLVNKFSTETSEEKEVGYKDEP